MTANTDFTGSVFSLSQEATGLRVAITCSECKTRQVGGDKPDYPIDTVSRHFAAKHWYITDKWRRAVCPECQKKRDKPAPDPLDVSKVQAALDKQREAEERRKAASAKTAAEVFGAPASNARPITADETAAKILEIIAEIPCMPHRTNKAWYLAPVKVANIVALFSPRPEHERSTIYHRVIEKCPGFKTTIYQFVKGLNSDGSREWPELRAAMADLGVDLVPVPSIRRGDRAQPTPAPAPTTATTAKEVAPMPAKTTPTTLTEPSREARRAHAAAIRLLDLHFTIADGAEFGRYADGWTDDRVAKNSGLSVAEVTRTREDVYGRLEDPQAVARERALADLSTRSIGARSGRWPVMTAYMAEAASILGAEERGQSATPSWPSAGASPTRPSAALRNAGRGSCWV